MKIRHAARKALLAALLVGAANTGALAQPPVAPNTALTPAQRAALWADLKQFWVESMALPGIDAGPASSDKRMLIYFDPNCPMCARQWQLLKPYLHTVRIHWIPFAYFNASSLRMSAGILAAKDPAAALAFNEDHYNFQTQTGGFLAPQDVPAWATEKVESIIDDPFVKQNIQATPTIGLALEGGRRYFAVLGVIDAPRLARIVQMLGRPSMRTPPGP